MLTFVNSGLEALELYPEKLSSSNILLDRYTGSMRDPRRSFVAVVVCYGRPTRHDCARPSFRAPPSSSQNNKVVTNVKIFDSTWCMIEVF